MKTLGLAVYGILLFTSISVANEAGRPTIQVPIVLGPHASRLEQLAADELARFLGARYLGRVRFFQADELPAQGVAIVIGTPGRSGPAERFIDGGELTIPGSYVVKRVPTDRRELGVIAGQDSRAVLHAAYALLEHLGYGFYLSYDASPTAEGSEDAFSFARWNLADAPRTGDRIVFNWHNFLSSCSTWDLPEWQHWIRQSARMRYTGVMVHAYGNNPMVCFAHHGQTKPVGYLTTTAKGRDWGTQHVNDVRRLYGAEGLFDGPVFGCRAAMVPDQQRADAARTLMKQVFAYAEERGMDVVFALDVDTESSNPPNVILTLPAGARFESAGHPLVNPDAPEGFAYYTSQVESLLGDYPQIDRLIVWFRRGGRTPWRRLKPENFPHSWKAEYQAALARHPGAADLPDGPSMFAIAKIVRAFRRILDGLGREDVKLGIGTWGFGHMAAADAFMPSGVTFMALDWSVEFDSPEVREQIRAVSDHRPMVPIVWAHHDDHTYIGRCYTPYAKFASRLDDYGAAGFGIIHWTTRPLDLYFKSLAQQVWKRTGDEPLEETCRAMAARTFGPEYADALGKYLLEWVTTAPQFGRETTDRFIDRPLVDPEETIAQCRRRLAMLEALGDPPLTLDYHKRFEHFMIEFFRNQTALEKSISLAQQGDAQGARRAIEACSPESVIEQYARAAREGEASRGEKALVISMNLRWLPYFEAQRQALGLSPVRINFQPTQHDPLAQGAGHRTFHVDPQQRFWLGLGEEETGAQARRWSGADVERLRGEGDSEVFESFIESQEGIRLRLRNIVGGRLTPGSYRVELLFYDPYPLTSRHRVLDVVLRGSQRQEAVRDRVDLFERSHVAVPKRVKDLPHVQDALRLTYELRIDQGELAIEVTPAQGSALLCGLVLTPIAIDPPEPVVRKRSESEVPIVAVTASGSVSSQYSPERTTDLDLRTRWAVEGTDHSIQYDLGRQVRVTHVAIAWFVGDRRKAKFDVQVSADGREWKQVFSGQSNGATRGLEPVDFDDVQARYVRLDCHGNMENPWNSITELAIYGR